MTSTDNGRSLWERQPWDTNAYRDYRRQMGAKQASTKVPGAWSAWSRGRHPTSGEPLPGAATWAERAAAFDAHVAQEELKQLAATNSSVCASSKAPWPN